MQSNIQILQTKKKYTLRRINNGTSLCPPDGTVITRSHVHCAFSEAKCGHRTSRNLRNSPVHYLLRHWIAAARTHTDLTYHFQCRLIPHQVDIDHEGYTGLTKCHGSCPLREGCPGKYLD